MGIFSNIVESIRDFTSNIIDTFVNILGRTSDIISTDYEPVGSTSFERQQDSYDYEDMFSDYIDWIHEAWY